MASSTPIGPGLYTEIGKRPRDLLYKDYDTAEKFTLTTFATGGAENEAIISGYQLHMQLKNVTVDMNVTSKSRKVIAGHFNPEQYTPGLKGILCIPIPYRQSASGKVELQYFHAHAGINASVGLNANPLVNLSGVIGTKALAFGADVAFDAASGDLTNYNAGMSLSNEDLTASLFLNNKGDTLAASYYQQLKNDTAVGAELAHSFSSNANTLIVGTQLALDRLNTVKGRFNNNGIASALIQHAWSPKFLVTVSTEFNSKDIEKSPKFGLALALKR